MAPGKFEGEPPLTEYFWDLVMESGQDDEFYSDGDLVAVFYLDKDDWNALKDDPDNSDIYEDTYAVAVWEDSQGFVNHQVFQNEKELETFRDSFEDADEDDYDEDDDEDRINNPSYAWIITKDLVSDGDDVDVMGPRGIKEKTIERLKSGEGEPFKMYDDDGNLYYEGRLIGDWESEDGFAPLDDFGEPNAGATEIRYRGKTL